MPMPPRHYLDYDYDCDCDCDFDKHSIPHPIRASLCPEKVLAELWRCVIKGLMVVSIAMQAKKMLIGLLVCPLIAMADPTPALPPVLLAAGDIADCGPGAASTAKLLQSQQGLILAIGDLAYPSGSREDFKRCYEPTWGKFRDRLKTVPGNHEYMTAGGKPYFTAMGDAAGPAGKGYYSFDFHGWHIIGLNSHIPINDKSPQIAWLKRDLAETTAQCVLSFVHLPRFSSGEGGDNDSLSAAWETLTQGGTSLVLAGHDHLYERLAPLDGSGSPSANGTRSFTVGTGGAYLDKKPWWVRRHSEKLISGQWGILKLDLSAESYRWSFITVDGQIADSGEGRCRERNMNKSKIQ